MKNFIKATLAFITIFLILPGFAGYLETHYTMEAKVVNFEVGNIVIIEDTTGNLWAVEAEGFKVGDKVKATFCTNYTDNKREDDSVEKIKKF